MKPSIEVELDDLFEEPRDLHADQMVCRVRQAMEEVARGLVPERPLRIRDPELEAHLVFDEGLPVEWGMVHPFACAFLHALRTWEHKGTPEHEELVERAVRTLLAAWARTIENVLLVDSLPDLGVDGREEDARDDYVAARRELVLQGFVIDTGRRRRGQIVWAASNVYQQHGTWDA